MIRRKLTLFVFGLALAGCQGEPDASVKDYMAGEVQPTAEIYWNAVQYISDEQGDHEIFPRNDAEWEDVRQAAVRLGEMGAELKEPQYAEGRGAAWIDFADGLIEVSAQAEKAAADKSTEAVFEVGGTVYSVCSACHQAYPPAEGLEGENEPG
jgi:outer membrane PBP1 activator LpoA protein